VLFMATVMNTRMGKVLALALALGSLDLACSSAPARGHFEDSDEETSKATKSKESPDDTPSEEPPPDPPTSTVPPATTSGGGTTSSPDAGAPPKKTPGGGGVPVGADECANLDNKKACAACCVAAVGHSCICDDQCAGECAGDILCGGAKAFTSECTACLKESGAACAKTVAEECQVCEDLPD
jgi:hypothetical protein